MPAKIKDINLLPKEPWEKGILGKLVRWTLTVGRYVVVFTELIVISAFLYRFSLDQKLTDLNEKIKEQQAIVSSYADFEAKFRLVQQQLDKIKTVSDESLNIKGLLDELSQITPLDVIYENIVVNQEEVVLQGRVLSEVGLATLLAKAQTSKNFDNVTLENISSGETNSSEINFRMVLSYAKK